MYTKRKIDKLGRIVLPHDYRKALGLEGEAEIILSIERDAITIRGKLTACRLCGSGNNILAHLGICHACVQNIKNF